jgi:hypothetical protein
VRSASALVVALATLLVVSVGEAAAASEARIVCVPRAPLTETPGGLVVGSVTRGDRVFVLKRAKGRRWVRVRTDFATRGWMRTSQLCG